MNQKPKQSEIKEGDLRTYPIPDNPCFSCPFGGKKPALLSSESYNKYISNLANLEGQHLCHSAQNKAICRGGRNIQLKILCARGLLSEPTDNAFNQAVNEAMKIKEANK